MTVALSSELIEGNESNSGIKMQVLLPETHRKIDVGHHGADAMKPFAIKGFNNFLTRYW